jgi:nitrile hydratase
VTARFKSGQRVRIAARPCAAHHRTPAYAKGRTGVVERLCGAFGQPETLATGGDGKPLQALYRVRLSQADLWPGYRGPVGDTLEIEIYEHWLEPA